MTKCNICTKRIWFWQTAVHEGIFGCLSTKYVKTAHWDCDITKMVEILSQEIKKLKITT